MTTSIGESQRQILYVSFSATIAFLEKMIALVDMLASLSLLAALFYLLHDYSCHVWLVRMLTHTVNTPSVLKYLIFPYQILGGGGGGKGTGVGS